MSAATDENPDLGLLPGDHVCAFYLGIEERDQMLLPFLRGGLEGGDKCLCIIDASEPAVLLDQIGVGLHVDLHQCLEHHQLEVQRSEDTYLASGRFGTAEMLGFWDQAIARLGDDGFESARIAGEMTWALRDVPGVDELMAYESELNRPSPRWPEATILCLYDLERFGGDVVVDLVKTHPKVLLGGMVLENPNHLSPDEFLATR
ncbi:MAG: protein kinase family protein [Actinomycetia bacterium]|nr:protein kinase family protein [Actinomycetes bacterium]